MNKPRTATPSPADVRASRFRAGLTHRAAAALIHCAERSWQDWESGARRMHPAMWELWRRKSGEI
jgi:DNA-binding transcriptional regulator YiaG